MTLSDVPKMVADNTIVSQPLGRGQIGRTKASQSSHVQQDEWFQPQGTKLRTVKLSAQTLIHFLGAHQE
jgi:hypothetical protein